MRQGSTTVALHCFQRRSPGTADLVHGCIFSNHGIIPHPVMTTTLLHTCSLCFLPLWFHLTPVLSHLCQPRGLCAADTFLPFLGGWGSAQSPETAANILSPKLCCVAVLATPAWESFWLSSFPIPEAQGQ